MTGEAAPTLLSVVVPARDEAHSLAETVEELIGVLGGADIPHEVVIVDDHSRDATAAVAERLCEAHPQVRVVVNDASPGFGNAVRRGLAAYAGDAVALVMADGSDVPGDLVTFYRCMYDGGYDAVFGSRFSGGGSVSAYPALKRVLNRIANNAIRILFRIRYDDVTNAFKLYRRSTIDGLQPLLSPHFNITAELPLKVIVRGYSYAWLPNAWRGRRGGSAKFRIKEMGSRYVFVLLYCLIERHFARGDFDKRRSG